MEKTEKKKDDYLLKLLTVYGEQLKPMTASMLKASIELHNHRTKAEELTRNLMMKLKSIGDSDLSSAELGVKVGSAIGLITLAHNAISKTNQIEEGAIRQLQDWAKDIQRVNDPKVVFRPPGAQPKGRIVVPGQGQGIVRPQQPGRKGGRIIH